MPFALVKSSDFTRYFLLSKYNPLHRYIIQSHPPLATTFATKMGKKNRFKMVSRELHFGRKLEQSPTLSLDGEAQLERFARNQWYRYFVQIEAKYRMVSNDDEITAAHQTMMLLGQPVGISLDSELGQKIEAELQGQRQEQEADAHPVETVNPPRRPWRRSRKA